MRSRHASAICTALAPILLLLGLLAGFVNHQVLDGKTFARHVDAIRRDPAVAHQIGLSISRRVLQVDPNLIALRPLLEASATSLASSPAFTPVIERTARDAHTYFTKANSRQVVLRLADVGSVLSGVLRAVSPQAASHIPPGMDVTLGEVGSQSVAAGTIRLAHLVGLLAWLLPLLGLLLLAAGVALAPDRLRAAFWSGWGVAGAGLAVGLVWLAGSFLAGVQDSTTLKGAVVSATWDELDRPLLRLALLTALAGACLSAAASARIPDIDIRTVGSRVWGMVSQPPGPVWARILRAVVLVAVGVGCLLQPTTMAQAAVVIIGWVLLLAGVGELATLAGARRGIGAEDAKRSKTWLPVVGLGTAGAVVVALIAYQSIPADRTFLPVAGNPQACNGHVQLCSRPYNDVSFAAAHNAMSAADEPGWFLPEQPTGLVGALDAGVRALLIDTWYGQSTTEAHRAVTAHRSYAAALEQARADFGDAVVQSALRLRNSFARAAGPVTPYMCHGLCETGSTPLVPALKRVKAWVDDHPREVVTFIIEDKVSPADTVAAFTDAGLLPYVYTHREGQAWPTLGSMIETGKRLVVMMERHGGGTAAPWLLSAFDYVSDTSYTNPSVASLSCTLNRGSLDDPLFMINNWLSSFSALVTDARTVNGYRQLLGYAQRCEKERHQIPNFVAVNYYNEGNVFKVVDKLNGF